MKRILSLLCAAMSLALLSGCRDSSAGEPFALESLTDTTEVTTTTSATTQTTVTETVSQTTASTTVTTTPEEATVVGKWVLDSIVRDGTVHAKDTSYTPPISYRQLLQVEFYKNGTVERIHPLYDYKETGTWTHVDEDERIIRVTLPYDTFFYNTNETLDFYFENNALFIKAKAGGGGEDSYFERVTAFPAPPTERAAAGKARMGICGFWECAWITADGETYTDEMDGVKIPSRKLSVMPEGDFCYYTGDDAKTERAYSLNYLSDNTLELLLKRSSNPYSTIGQIEGTVYKKNNYLLWRYDDHTVMSFREISEEDFKTALFPDEFSSAQLTTAATTATTRATTSATTAAKTSASSAASEGSTASAATSSVTAAEGSSAAAE